MKKLFVVISACLLISISASAHDSQSSRSDDFEIHSKYTFPQWVKKLDVKINGLRSGKSEPKIMVSNERLSSSEFVHHLEENYIYKRDNAIFGEDDEYSAESDELGSEHLENSISDEENFDVSDEEIFGDIEKEFEEETRINDEL